MQNDASISSTVGTGQDEQYVLTRAGLEQRRQTLEALRTTYRPQLERQIRRRRLLLPAGEGAPEQIGLFSNLDDLDRQIAELEKIVTQAKVIGDGPVPETVQPGWGVTVRYDDGKGDEAILTLVGPLEVALSRDYIAMNSPVGRALLDKGVGAKVKAEDGTDSVELTVVSIEKSRPDAEA